MGDLVESLSDIGDQVFSFFQTDVEANERTALAPVGHRARGNRDGCQAFVATPAGAAGEVLELIGKLDGVFFRVAVGKFNGEHAVGALVITHEDVVVGMRFKLRIEDRLDFRTGLEIFDDGVVVLFVLSETNTERTQAAQDEVAVIGAGREARASGSLSKFFHSFSLQTTIPIVTSEWPQ